MDCSDYLLHLSDFRDGRLTDRRVMRRLQVHLRGCARCRRHLEALEHGLGELQALDIVAPSEDFRTGLHRRLAAEVSLGDPVRPTNTGLAAAFLLAAAVGLFVYEGMARAEHDVALAADLPADAGGPVFPVPAQPVDTVDVTLPAFSHTTLEFHSAHAPLGGFAALGR